jgi:hypothetical protein
MDFFSLKQFVTYIPGNSKLYAIAGLLSYSLSLILPVTRIQENEEALRGW